MLIYVVLHIEAPVAGLEQRHGAVDCEIQLRRDLTSHRPHYCIRKAATVTATADSRASVSHKNNDNNNKRYNKGLPITLSIIMKPYQQ